MIYKRTSNLLKIFVASNKRLAYAFLFIFIYSATVALAIPPATQYNPGETLDPNCAPGDTNCSVVLGGSSVSLSAITSASGANTINNANLAQEWQWNSLTTQNAFRISSNSITTGKLLDLQVSGTAAGASQTALNILTTGANATNGITTYGAQISNTHTGSSSTNTALYLNASGATQNYALSANGDVSVNGRLALNSTITPTGPELITNGTFSSGTTGWVLGDCASHNGGAIDIIYDLNVCTQPTLSTTFSVAAGNTYYLSFNGLNAEDQIGIEMTNINSYSRGPFGSYYNASTIFYSNYTGTVTITFYPKNYFDGAFLTIDNVSIKSVSSLISSVISATSNTGVPFMDFNDTLDVITVGTGAQTASNVGTFRDSNFFGRHSGQNSSSVTNVNFFGNSAGYFTNSLDGSNFFGESSGAYSSADNANFFGLRSGFRATGANNSNFFGAEAGNGAFGASDSNFFGASAGITATSATRSNFLGYHAGALAASASYSNLFGYYAGANFTGNSIGTNNIIIGTNISLPNTRTNSLNIGGVLFGTGTYSTTTGDPSIIGNSGGKIGILTPSPSSTLHVKSSGTTTGELFRLDDSADTNRLLVLDNGTTTFTPNVTTTSGLTVTANALTTGTAFIIPHTTSVIASGGSLMRLSSTSADTSTTTGVLLDLSSTSSTSGTQFLQTYSGLTTGIGQSIVANSLTTGAALSVTSFSLSSGTGVFRVSSNSQSGVTALISAAAISTGTALNITGNAGLTTGGEMINISMLNSSAGNGIVITNTGTYTGTGLINLTADTATTGTIQAISANGLTTGHGITISSSGTITTTGDLMALTGNSATTTTGLFRINSTGLTTGYAQLINVAGTTSLTTGGAINIDGPTGAATMNGTTGLVNISTTGAITNSTTGAGSGTLFQITANGAITPTIASISDTSVMTTTGKLLDLTANAATTTTGLLTMNATGLTTGYAQAINVNGAAVLTTGGAINITGPTGAANLTGGTGLLRISSSGAVTGTAGAGTLMQLNGTGTLTATLASITDTSVMTTTGNLLTLTANSATTTTGLLTISGTGLTTGSALSIVGGSPLTTGGVLANINMGAATAGNGIAISNTGVYTGTGLITLTANSATTGTLQLITSSSLTTGKLLDLQVSGTAAGASQTALNILTTGANGTAGITTYGAQISNTHSTNTSTNVALLLNATGGATANYALVTTSGNVGIGNTAPAVLLHAGSSAVTDGTTILRLEDANSTCNFTADAGGPSCGSDFTLKKDINSLDTKDLLTKVSALNPVSYRWITDDVNANLQYGFIAQEVGEQFANLVSDNLWIDGTTRKFLNTGGLMPYVVGAIKEINLNIIDISNLTRGNTWRDALVAWFGNAGNKITRIFTGEICITEAGEEPVCINRSELLQLKGMIGNPLPAIPPAIIVEEQPPTPPTENPPEEILPEEVTTEEVTP